MKKIGVKQAAQMLDGILRSLQNEAPFCSLQATSTDPNDPRVYCIEYQGFYTWPIGRPAERRSWDWRRRNLRGRYYSNTSQEILLAMQEQQKRALGSMDEFYRTAVQHLAPQLVMQVLDGGSPSFKQAFNIEVGTVISMLSKTIEQAGTAIRYRHYDLECNHKLFWAKAEVATLYMDEQKLRMNLPGNATVMTYLVLPQIAQHVALWVTGLNAIAAALPKQQEDGVTVPEIAY